MTMIAEAAALIREFSTATADAFVARPFQRLLLAEAFEAGFTRHTDYTRKVCALVLCVARLDQINRALAAQRQAETEAAVAAAPDSFTAYWEGSASASIMRDYKAGRVVTIKAGK